MVAINKAVGATDGNCLTFELCSHNFGDHRVHSEKPSGMYDEENRNLVHNCQKYTHLHEGHPLDRLAEALIAYDKAHPRARTK